MVCWYSSVWSLHVQRRAMAPVAVPSRKIMTKELVTDAAVIVVQSVHVELASTYNRIQHILMYFQREGLSG